VEGSDVHVYNCKGNALEYSSYRAKILLERVMTIYGWVVEVRVSIAKIVVTQFGFMAAKLTRDATLIARQLQQKCRAKNKDLRMERRLTEYQWMWCALRSECGWTGSDGEYADTTMVTDSPLAFTVYRCLCG